MMFSKILACFLLVAGLSCFSTLGVNISSSCLLEICLLNSTGPCASYPYPSNRSVASQDVSYINGLLKLQTSEGSNLGDDCSCNDVSSCSNEIQCDYATDNGTCRVTYIDFSYMELEGKLPAHIDNLTYLRYLDLSGNNLEGPVPAFNGENKELQTLDLSGNMLSGLIPPSLVHLKQLRYLDLSSNNLTGPVPAFNGENKEVQTLDLSRNQLNGSIPTGLGELPLLRYLSLEANTLNGTIPNEIWNFTSLQSLRLQDNQLEGQIPEQFANLTNLENLYLMNNNFSGEFPKRIGELTNLQYLKIQGSNFNGTIPESLSQLQSLSTLWLVGNNFKGPLPKAFSSANLQDLAITDVSGDVEKGNQFPEVRNLTSLTTLKLRNCSLMGPIPSGVWKLPYLYHLDLSFNYLNGTVPPMDPRINAIFLRRNNLTGSLPAWVNSTRNIDVSENNFTSVDFLNGTISKDTNLFACCTGVNDPNRKWLDVSYRCAHKQFNDSLYINCGGNRTTVNGTTYEADLDPDGKSTFFLSNDSTWAYSSMGAFEYSNNDQHTVNQTCNMTMDDASLYTGARVAPISLKYYGFCLRNDNYTVRLYFAEIGWDPIKDKNIGGRRVFNVEIQGKKKLEHFNIKEAAGGIYQSKTVVFNTSVTDNRLEIHFYWSGKGSMYEPRQYGPLISAISVSAVPKELVPKKHRKLSSVSIGAIVGSSFIFIALILALFWKLGWLGGKKPNKDGVELYPGAVFNFEEIKAATNNFDVTKSIDETGSVYMVVLPDGVEIAVKKLSVKSKQEAHQIINEIGILYALQHPNVAKPMGCCMKERQVLIVYKYMENISLQHALFGSPEVKSTLSWQIRFKICLGIAKGLAFLHEESKLDIIHSNIKPTNILLDEDFNVKISDFRYSELHDGQLNKRETTLRNMPRAKDTAHMSPEYMLGLPLTPKADVYSFGLVMLEIISGQPLITGKTKEDILLINTAYKYFEEGFPEGLIDGDLKSHKDYKPSEAISLLHLAMLCVSPSFDLRPTMSEVVQILQGKKKIKGKRINPSPIAEPLAGLSQSARYGSTSQEGASGINISESDNIKAEDSGISAD